MWRAPKGALMSEVIHGACLCGRVEFDVNEPEVMGACHCTRCQRWSGGPGSTVVVVAAKNFKVTKGKDQLKLYHEGEFADRYFCGNCGSGVYVDGGEKYYVGAGCLRDVKLKNAFHIQVAYKAPWDEIGGSAPQFPEWPPA
jgi:hypothetical protein